MPYGVNGTGYLFGDTAKYQSDCLDCPGGYWCGSATVDPTPCQTGNYSEPAQSVCVQCEAGYYCDQDNTSETVMLTDKRCPAGLYCPAALRDLADAMNCSDSHYCPEGECFEYFRISFARDKK